MSAVQLAVPTRVTVRAHSRHDGAAQRVVSWADPLTGPHRRTVPLDYGARDSYTAAIRAVFGDGVTVEPDLDVLDARRIPSGAAYMVTPPPARCQSVVSYGSHGHEYRHGEPGGLGYVTKCGREIAGGVLCSECRDAELAEWGHVVTVPES